MYHVKLQHNSLKFPDLIFNFTVVIIRSCYFCWLSLVPNRKVMQGLNKEVERPHNLRKQRKKATLVIQGYKTMQKRTNYFREISFVYSSPMMGDGFEQVGFLKIVPLLLKSMFFFLLIFGSWRNMGPLHIPVKLQA